MNETLTVLNSINEKLGLIVMAMQGKPAYVKVAEKTLEASNATVEEVVPVVQQNEEAQPASTEETQTNEIVIGSRVTYTGEDREALFGLVGTVVDLRNAWTVVRFDDQSSDAKCRKKDLSLSNNEQPPEKTEAEVDAEMFGTPIESQQISVEAHLEDSEAQRKVGGEGRVIAASEVLAADNDDRKLVKLFDEEAATFKFTEGSYKQYRDIHAIYSDPKKTEGNRRYLRFRAQNVVKGDTVAKEMCHRYLIGVQDEVYLKERAGQ